MFQLSTLFFSRLFHISDCYTSPLLLPAFSMAKSTIASSSKQKDPKVSAPKKSASQISSSDSEGSDSSGDEDSDSVDSEGDIEAVTPKKKQTQTVTGGSSSGRSLS